MADVSGAQIHIRRASPHDARAIAELLEATFSAYRPCYTEGGYRATVIPPAEVLSRLDEGPTWIAVSQNEIFGTVSAVITNDGLYIRSMAVMPTVQSRGVARALLNTVEDFAIKSGLHRMYLSTTPFLHAAIRLYEKSGFQRTVEGPSHLFDTPLFSMSKNLP